MSGTLRRVLAGVTAGVAATVVLAAPAQAGPRVDYPPIPSAADISIAEGATVRTLAVERGAGYVATATGDRRIWTSSTAMYGQRNTGANRATVSVVKSARPVITQLFSKYGGRIAGTVEPTTVLVDNESQKVIAGVATLPGLSDPANAYWGVEEFRITGDGRVLVSGACYKTGVEPFEGEELADLARCASRVTIAAANAQN